MNQEIVESMIRRNVPWSKLPEDVRATLGNYAKEYDKCVVTFSIRNQLRFKGNLVCHVRKDEKRYYEDLVDYSKKNLMLFPYHLSDVVVKSVTMTPFQYYVQMLELLMSQEKSYDSLPNFAAADCLRLLGIGRNQYIDLMNVSRSNKKFGFFRMRNWRELLPSKPVANVTILPWWTAQVGFVTEEDIKSNVDKAEHCMIDQLIDSGPCPAGHLNYPTLHSLYRKGLVYFDVPIGEDDVVAVPPLEGFVMNRVLGDYFETLLYKIFVSIDEHTTVQELASVLEVDVNQVQDAVSLYCRLGFARKKNAELDPNDLHPSWYEFLEPEHLKGPSVRPPVAAPGVKKESMVITVSSDEDDSLLLELNKELACHEGVNDTDCDEITDDDFVKPDQDDDSGCKIASISPGSLNRGTSAASQASPQTLQQQQQQQKKKIGFLFDSKLTAYLMMGNLSSGLKTHAVTMFEVGKLSDESLDSLVAELEKVSDVEGEGEAARYFAHALTLRETILFLRQNPEFQDPAVQEEQGTGNGSKRLGLDLVRCESLLSLNPSTASRLLNKNYSLLFSMAPMVNDIRPVDIGCPPHLGPAIPEMSSIWFKMFLYHATGNGPPSLLLPKGSRLRRLPKVFYKCNHLLVTSWGNEPSKIAVSSAMSLLLDTLQHSAVLVQAYRAPSSTAEVVDHDVDDDHVDSVVETLPFPFQQPGKTVPAAGKVPPACLEKLKDVVDVSHSCGYVSLLNLNPVLMSYAVPEVKEAPPSSDVGPNGCLNPDAVGLLMEALLDQVGPEKVDSGGDDLQLDKSHNTDRGVKAGENWVLMELSFGIPLFDPVLNKQVCRGIVENKLWRSDSLDALAQSSRDLCIRLLAFISQHRANASGDALSAASAEVPWPTMELFFDGRTLHKGHVDAFL